MLTQTMEILLFNSKLKNNFKLYFSMNNIQNIFNFLLYLFLLLLREIRFIFLKSDFRFFMLS